MQYIKSTGVHSYAEKLIASLIVALIEFLCTRIIPVHGCRVKLEAWYKNGSYIINNS